MTTSSENFIVIDTHPLVWYFENNPRLSSNASDTFDLIDEGDVTGIIPTIVLAEIIYISDRGRIALTFDDVVERIDGSRNFSIAPLDLRILRFMIGHKSFEIHDRIIVSTALHFGTRLMTKDEVIRNSGIVECVW